MPRLIIQAAVSNKGDSSGIVLALRIRAAFVQRVPLSAARQCLINPRARSIDAGCRLGHKGGEFGKRLRRVMNSILTRQFNLRACHRWPFPNPGEGLISLPPSAPFCFFFFCTGAEEREWEGSKEREREYGMGCVRRVKPRRLHEKEFSTVVERRAVLQSPPYISFHAYSLTNPLSLPLSLFLSLFSLWCFLSFISLHHGLRMDVQADRRGTGGVIDSLT